MPTSADDVFFDANSGTGTCTWASGGGTCRSINCTGYTGTCVHSSGVTMNVGDATAGASSVALKLVSGMTYTLGNTTTSQWNFISTSATQQTVDFGGKTCGNLIFNGSGASWLLSSAITNATTGTFTHTNGTFNANGQTLSTGKYVTASGTKTLTMGAATWTLTGTGTVWDFATSAPTFNANTSTIIVSDTSATGKTFAGNGKTFNVVTFSGDNITVSGANSFATINVNNAGRANGLKFPNSTTTTITSSMSTNGSTGSTCIIRSVSTGTTTTLSKSSGTVTLDYANIRDVTATGGATWVAANGIFTSNNTGIYFESTAKAAGGNWSSTGTWLNATVPTNNYHILLDSTSGNVTLDSAPVCSSLDCTGYTGTLTNTAGLTCSGALANRQGRVLKLVSGMAYSGSGAITISKTQAAQETLDFGGKTIGAITFSGSGGSWKFNDAMSGTTLSHTNGTLNTNGQSVTCSSTMGMTGGTQTLGASQISCTTFTGSRSSITANTSKITCTNLVSTTSLTLYDLSIIPTAAQSVTLSTNHTVSHNLVLTGFNSTNARMYLGSNTRGTARTLTCNGTVTASQVLFEDITAAGSANWDLSASIVGDCDGNTGITFTTPQTQTWSGTSGGNWSANAWTSRVPLPQDDVLINQAFSAQTITGDISRSGRNVDFTGSTGLTLTPSAWTIFGSLTFAAGMTIGSSATVFQFAGRRTATFTTNGVSCISPPYFNTISGTVFLGDNCSINRSFSASQILDSGSLDLNGFNLTMTGGYGFRATGTGTLYLRSGTLSAVLASGGTAQFMFNAGLTVVCGTSTIIASGTGQATFAGFGNTFYNVTISADNTTISGSNTFNTLAINQAGNATGLKLTSGTTQTVTNITTNGSSGNLAKLVSSSAGSPATISCASGTISVDYMSIQDSTATGGATFYAGANSSNVSGNTGWIFTAPPASSIVPMMQRILRPIFQR